MCQYSAGYKRKFLFFLTVCNNIPIRWKSGTALETEMVRSFYSDRPFTARILHTASYLPIFNPVESLWIDVKSSTKVEFLMY